MAATSTSGGRTSHVGVQPGESAREAMLDRLRTVLGWCPQRSSPEAPAGVVRGFLDNKGTTSPAPRRRLLVDSVLRELFDRPITARAVTARLLFVMLPIR